MCDGWTGGHKDLFNGWYEKNAHFAILYYHQLKFRYTYMFLFTLLYFTSLDRCGHTDQKFRDLVTQLQQLTEENQMFRSDRIQLNRQLHQKVGK